MGAGGKGAGLPGTGGRCGTPDSLARGPSHFLSDFQAIPEQEKGVVMDLRVALDRMPDPRKRQGRRHPLGAALVPAGRGDVAWDAEPLCSEFGR